MPLFFQLSSWALGLILFAIVLGTTGLGLLLGRSQRHRSDSLREPLAVLQAALLGVVGLILAFGLALAVGRYEARRGAVVEEANAIGTTYLRAQTLAEPIRTGSLQRLVRYTDTSIALSQSVPGSPAGRKAAADGQQLQRQLWALAGQALEAAPIASAPRLYVESLNQMIDLQTVRVAGLNNRVPGPVLVLEVAGAAVALGLLAFCSPSTSPSWAGACSRCYSPPPWSPCCCWSPSTLTGQPVASSAFPPRPSPTCGPPWPSPRQRPVRPTPNHRQPQCSWRHGG
jgi:hypothetical protein